MKTITKILGVGGLLAALGCGGNDYGPLNINGISQYCVRGSEGTWNSDGTWDGVTTLGLYVDVNIDGKHLKNNDDAVKRASIRVFTDAGSSDFFVTHPNAAETHYSVMGNVDVLGLLGGVEVSATDNTGTESGQSLVLVNCEDLGRQ